MLRSWFLVELTLAWLAGLAWSDCLTADGRMTPTCPTVYRTSDEFQEPREKVGEVCLMDGGCGTLSICEAHVEKCCRGDSCNSIRCYDKTGRTVRCLTKKGCALGGGVPKGCFQGEGEVCHTDKCNPCQGRSCQIKCLTPTGQTQLCHRRNGCAPNLGGCGKFNPEHEDLPKGHCYEDECNHCDMTDQSCVMCMRDDGKPISCPLKEGCATHSPKGGCYVKDEAADTPFKDGQKNRLRCFTENCNDCGNNCDTIKCLDRDGARLKCPRKGGCATWPPQSGCGRGGTSVCFFDNCNEDVDKRNCGEDVSGEPKPGSRACCKKKGGKWLWHPPKKCNPLEGEDKALLKNGQLGEVKSKTKRETEKSNPPRGRPSAAGRLASGEGAGKPGNGGQKGTVASAGLVATALLIHCCTRKPLIGA